MESAEDILTGTMNPEVHTRQGFMLVSRDTVLASSGHSRGRLAGDSVSDSPQEIWRFDEFFEDVGLRGEWEAIVQHLV